MYKRQVQLASEQNDSSYVALSVACPSILLWVLVRLLPRTLESLNLSLRLGFVGGAPWEGGACHVFLG